MGIESSKRKHRVQSIDNAQRTSKNVIIFRLLEPTCCDQWLLLLATAANVRCGISTSEDVQLPSALAATVTVLVPLVPTGVTRGH